MDNNTNKDNWVEEILSSADKVKRASASPFIFPKILNKIKDNSRFKYIPIKRAAIGFVTLILLAIINVFVLFNSGNSSLNIKTGNTKTGSTAEFIPSQYNPYLEILNSN